MEFFKVLDELKTKYSNNSIERRNGTLLLSPLGVPRAEHTLFKPLDDKTIDEFLVQQCEVEFPAEYIEFLKYTNGANLCFVKVWHTVRRKKLLGKGKEQRIPTAGGLFVIFGLPRTQPYGRPDDMEEPYDLRVEDLSRHDDLPKHWIKCGTYIYDYDFHNPRDIFIDTADGRVHAVHRNGSEILASWDNLDACLCEIYRSLEDRRAEYEF